MTDHVNLPTVVVGTEAPDHVQHMATDINDTINRLNSVITRLIADQETSTTDLATLRADVDALIATGLIYSVGAYGR